MYRLYKVWKSLFVSSTNFEFSHFSNPCTKYFFVSVEQTLTFDINLPFYVF